MGVPSYVVFGAFVGKKWVFLYYVAFRTIRVLNPIYTTRVLLTTDRDHNFSFLTTTDPQLGQLKLPVQRINLGRFKHHVIKSSFKQLSYVFSKLSHTVNLLTASQHPLCNNAFDQLCIFGPICMALFWWHFWWNLAIWKRPNNLANTTLAIFTGLTKRWKRKGGKVERWKLKTWFLNFFGSLTLTLVPENERHGRLWGRHGRFIVN